MKRAVLVWWGKHIWVIKRVVRTEVLVCWVIKRENKQIRQEKQEIWVRQEKWVKQDNKVSKKQAKWIKKFVYWISMVSKLLGHTGSQVQGASTPERMVVSVVKPNASLKWKCDFEGYSRKWEKCKKGKWRRLQWFVANYGRWSRIWYCE